MNFLKDIIAMFADMFGDWPIGTTLGILILLFILIIAVCVAYGVFVAIDSWFLSKKQGVGKIISKKFTPAHTQMVSMFNAATKTSMTQPIHHPDDWSICVEVAGQQDSISVDQKLFNLVSEGDSVFAEYVCGRLSGSLHLNDISCA